MSRLWNKQQQEGEKQEASVSPGTSKDLKKELMPTRRVKRETSVEKKEVARGTRFPDSD